MPRLALVPIIMVAFVATTGCTKKETPREPTITAPGHVQASFAAFADSVMPRVRHTLDSAGYRVHRDSGAAASGSPTAQRDHVLPLRLPEAQARLYQAPLSLSFTYEDPELGISLPGAVMLQFVSTGSADHWALLTTDGFLYDVLDGGRSKLPLDVQLAIRNQLATTMEVGSWRGYMRYKLANPDSARRDSAWLTWARSLRARAPNGK